MLDFTLFHLSIAITEKVSIQMAVGLLRHFFNQCIVIFKLIRELMHDLSHTIQVLKEYLGFILAFGFVQALT